MDLRLIAAGFSLRGGAKKNGETPLKFIRLRPLIRYGQLFHSW